MINRCCGAVGVGATFILAPTLLVFTDLASFYGSQLFSQRPGGPMPRRQVFSPLILACALPSDDAALAWAVHDTNPDALSRRITSFVKAPHSFRGLTTIGAE
jgi:hypothetical protein